MDFSNYPKDHPNYDASTSCMPFLLKDEGEGRTLEEVCGLSPKTLAKVYADSPKAKITAKGLAKTARKNITMEDYKTCLFTKQPRSFQQSRFVKKDFKIYTAVETKRGLNPTDTKMYIKDDGISTLAHGHWRIPVLRKMSGIFSRLKDLDKEDAVPASLLS